MLVLARRIGEEIVIDGDIRVTVVGVRGSQVRLGVVAPPSVRVLRQEVANRATDPADAPLVLSKAPPSSLDDSRIMSGLIQVAR